MIKLINKTKKLIKFIPILLIILLPVDLNSAPRGYYTTGPATEDNLEVTFDFNPSGFCIKNTGSTNEMYADFTDGEAEVDSTDSTNFYFAPGAQICFDTEDPNVTNDFIVGVICDTGETTTYEIFGIHR
jgi:hypothetical protein